MRAKNRRVIHHLVPHLFVDRWYGIGIGNDRKFPGKNGRLRFASATERATEFI